MRTAARTRQVYPPRSCSHPPETHPIRYTFTIFCIQLVISFIAKNVLSLSIVRSWPFPRSSSVSTRRSTSISPSSRLLVVEDPAAWRGWTPRRDPEENCFVFAVSVNDCCRLKLIVVHIIYEEHVYKLCWSVANKDVLSKRYFCSINTGTSSFADNWLRKNTNVSISKMAYKLTEITSQSKNNRKFHCFSLQLFSACVNLPYFTVGVWTKSRLPSPYSTPGSVFLPFFSRKVERIFFQNFEKEIQ